jgi:cytidine deaminase
VAGGSTDRTGFCTPCGGCRQRISEFADENTRIIVKDDDETWHKYSLADLLPSSFHL